MKKFQLFFILGLSMLFVTRTYADIKTKVLADFETYNVVGNLPNDGEVQMYGTNISIPGSIVANPAPNVATNNSANVAKLSKDAGKYQLVGFGFKPYIKASKIKKVRFWIYGSMTGIFVQAATTDTGKNSALNVTWDNAVNYSGWTHLEYTPDFSSTDSSITAINIFPNMESADPGDFYVDNVEIDYDDTQAAVASVSIDPVLSVMVGQTFSLVPVVSPAEATDKSVSWLSLDENTARVSANGAVLGKAQGTTKIIVTTKDGNFKDTCEVTVTPYIKPTINPIVANWEDVIPATAPGAGVWQFFGPNVVPQDIIDNPFLNADNQSAKVIRVMRPTGDWSTFGFFYQDGIPVTADITGVEVLVYSNSLAKVRVAVSGLIGGIADQQYSESVYPWTAPSGPNKWNKVIVPIDGAAHIGDFINTILVQPNPDNDASEDTVYIDEAKFIMVKTIKSVTLDVHETTMDVNDYIYLNSTVDPADASNTNITWESTNPSVASVSLIGKVVALSEGSTNIVVHTEDGNLTDTCKVTVNPVTGINISQSGKVSVYPNPYKGSNLCVSFGTAINEHVQVEVYDITGKVVAQEQQLVSGTQLKFSPALNAGTYFVKVLQGSTVNTFKIIAQ
jgi:uncharacterized protein YjdB